MKTNHHIRLYGILVVLAVSVAVFYSCRKTDKPQQKTITRTISTEDGYDLRINEAGQLDGIPVLVLHGTPGSKLLSPALVDDARAQGIRLISYDRPGYGGSTPRPGRNVASAASDVSAIAQQLNLERVLVWGVSGGGPHALACAALLPDLVVAVAAVASVAPYQAEGLDWLAGMGEDNLIEFGAALDGRDSLVQFIEAVSPGFLSTDPADLVEAMSSLLCPADLDVLSEDYAIFMLQKISEGIKERRDGWIDDDLAFITPWGFDLNQIQIPMLLLHGEQDQFVPFSHGQWLSSKIPNVNVRFSADDGHLSLQNRISEVHKWLISKM